MTEAELLKSLQKRLPAQTNYRVGYKKPPAEHQFKPGRSGNRNGRPKGAKNKYSSAADNRFRDMILEEAGRLVEVNEGGKKVKFSIMKAATRTVMVKAAKGDARAADKALNLYSQAELSRQREHLELFAVAIDYQNSWRPYLADMAARGLKPIQPPIHPNHIHIDPFEGEITFERLTDEQKENRDWIRSRLDEMAEENLARQRELNETTDPRKRKRLTAKIQETKEAIAGISEKLDAAGLY